MGHLRRCGNRKNRAEMSLLRPAIQVALFVTWYRFCDARKNRRVGGQMCAASKNRPLPRYETGRLGKDDSYDDCGPRITRNMVGQAGLLYYYYY
ncbi:hypothetical protein TRIATDRAFT_159115 [Trichoderma atroviride IMI 206040]|uniref:Uncharacterized protein n=1 Tax=Hypocrea atroviridis (strain ATCC 20476 / IMI 206040) TaxID=452589 RepID=G9P6H2_HYPAI|nr:uncharacterized protein TRIATDRAFT_159115 [Trichoderma atroviride IMI 206040]EHK40615.1 hypothetical protein TRIATDRAFT_159115 [Trichoderma atroviride IMI 206040]